MVPDSRLFARLIWKTLAKSPKFGGMGPVNSLRASQRVPKLASRPSSAGMEPDSRLSARSSLLSLANPPTSGGILPDNPFSSRVNPVTRPVASTRTPCQSPSGASVSQFSELVQFGPVAL